MLWRYLAEIITPVILGGLLTLSNLKPLVLTHLVPVGKAAVLFAEILLIVKETKVRMHALLIVSVVSVSKNKLSVKKCESSSYHIHCP